MDIKNLVGANNPYAKNQVQDQRPTEQAQRADPQQPTPRQAQTAQAESGTGADVVNLSNEGKLRNTALNEARNASDTRSERVRKLKEQVRDGTYKPDLKKAAANLIRDDLELLT